MVCGLQGQDMEYKFFIESFIRYHLVKAVVFDTYTLSPIRTHWLYSFHSLFITGKHSFFKTRNILSPSAHRCTSRWGGTNNEWKPFIFLPFIQAIRWVLQCRYFISLILDHLWTAWAEGLLWKGNTRWNKISPIIEPFCRGRMIPFPFCRIINH